MNVAGLLHVLRPISQHYHLRQLSAVESKLVGGPGRAYRACGRRDVSSGLGTKSCFPSTDEAVAFSWSPCSLSWQVTFVEVSAQFLPDDCLGVAEFTALDHQHNEAVFEWVPPDQGPEVSML